MWNPKQAHHDEDDSWEIRAFAEDTANIMGTTWPPRFYTCTFCRREFRTAQALGGHMNVHRRDRARFHHQTQPNSTQPISSSTSSSFTIPTAQVVYHGGRFCLFYQLSGRSCCGFLNPNSLTARIQSPSGTPYPSSSPTALSLPSTKSLEEVRATSSSSSHCSQISSKGDETLISVDDVEEKLDLELRLGQRPSSASKTQEGERLWMKKT